MNSQLLHPDLAFVAAAAEQFRESTGLATLHISLAQDGRHLLATQQLQRGALHYQVLVKRTVDRYATLAELRGGAAAPTTLLVCEQMTPELSNYCKAIGQQFIDTAGNAYLADGKDFLVLVAGRKARKEATSARKGSMTPAATRLAFAFLSDAALLNAPYRALASALNMSIGAVSKGLEALAARGFVGIGTHGKRVLLARGRLVEEWTAGYLARIRPKCQTLQFSADNFTAFESYPVPSWPSAAWGGEMAADLITRHLKPAHFTIYMDLAGKNGLQQMIKACRMRADASGNIEIVQPFWNMAQVGTDGKTVPLPVIYADLVSTLDPRNLTVAADICERILADAIHSG